MFRIAICDDDLNFISYIKEILLKWEKKPEDFVIITFTNGDSLLNSHIQIPFDIILLDILIPFSSGIETAMELRKYDKSVKIIFLTSSKEFAIDSYSVKASNYLLKPINTDYFYQCLNELMEEIEKDLQYIYVHTQNAVVKILLKEIEYIETQNKHVLFSLRNHSTLDSISPLYVYEKKLCINDGFFKCHRSYIVNMQYIDTYTTKEIKMHSGYRIPIARNRHIAFKDAYFSYIFQKAGE